MQGELIHLQLGNFANYAATHFWNAQSNRTPHPRTVIVDLKGNYGHAVSRSLEAPGLPAEESTESGTWGGNLISYVQAPKAKSAYHQLWDSNEEKQILIPPSQISSWDDFNYPLYHPKSMVPLPYFTIPDAFEVGTSLFRENEWGNTLIETHLRYFAEACDHLTEFQVWASLDDAFAGIFMEAALFLSDLYPKASIVTHTFAYELHRNLALTTSQVCDTDIMHWSWSSSKSEFYSTSAWPCVGIDTFLQSRAFVSTAAFPNLIVPHLQSSCYSPFQPGVKFLTFERSPARPAPDAPPHDSKVHITAPFPCVSSFPIHNIPQVNMNLHQPTTLQPLYPFLNQDLRESLEEYIR